MRNRDRVEEIRRSLPLPAHARPALATMIRDLRPNAPPSTPFLVTGVVDAGAGRGIMCRIEWRDHGQVAPILFATIRQLRFDRRSARRLP